MVNHFLFVLLKAYIYKYLYVYNNSNTLIAFLFVLFVDGEKKTMTMLSPALVIAMCVLFVLTRIHKHMYIFEVPFLFGLKYCRQIEQDTIDTFLQTKSSNPNSNATSPSSPTASSTSSSTLPIRLGVIGPAFFESAGGSLPYLSELHHILSLTISYIISAVFELALSCNPRIPPLATSRSSFIAIFTIVYTTVHLWRLSLFLSSARVMLLLSGSTALLTLLLSVAVNPALVDAKGAFHALFILLRGKVGMASHGAERWAGLGVGIIRVVLVSGCAVIAAGVVVPARRFALTDFAVRNAFINGNHHDDDDHDHDHDSNHHDGVDDDQKNVAGAHGHIDEFAVGMKANRPSILTVIRIMLDYIIPVAGIILLGSASRYSRLPTVNRSEAMNLEIGSTKWWWYWSSSPRAAILPAWRIYIVLIVSIFRLFQVRPRLQSYLDGAIDTFRKFWLCSPTSSPKQLKARTIVTTIAGTSYYLPMFAVAYVGPIIIVILLCGIVIVDGDIAPPVCPKRGLTMPGQVLATESMYVLATGTLVAYSFFVTLSALVEYAMIKFGLVAGDKGDGGSHSALSRTGSERRRDKRLMHRNNNAKQRVRKQ